MIYVKRFKGFVYLFKIINNSKQISTITIYDVPPQFALRPMSRILYYEDYRKITKYEAIKYKRAVRALTGHDYS